MCGLSLIATHFTYKGAIFCEIRAVSTIFIQAVMSAATFTVNLLQSSSPVLARFEVDGCREFYFFFSFLIMLGNCI